MNCKRCDDDDRTLDGYGYCDDCAWVYVRVPHVVGGTILSMILRHPDKELAATCTRPWTQADYILTEWHVPAGGLRCESWDARDDQPARHEYRLRVRRGYQEKTA